MRRQRPTRVLQVTSYFDPDFADGSTDYARQLACTFQKVGPIENSFGVVYPNHPLDSGNLSNPGPFTVVGRNAKTLVNLAQKLQPDSLLLHFHPSFPFVKRDLKLNSPDWLARALLEVKRTLPQLKLGIFFHELPLIRRLNQVMDWKLFYPRQSAFIRCLLGLSDVSFTSNAFYLNLLKGLLPKKKLYQIPVFSNIGEPKTLPDFEKRDRSMVIFGNSTKKRVFDRGRQLIEFCIQNQVSLIHEIGPADTRRKRSRETFLTLTKSSGIKVLDHGLVPESVASEIFQSARFGLLDYSLNLHCLAKSGVFAAYAASGLVPVLTQDNQAQADGLTAGEHYLTFHEESVLPDEALVQVAKSASDWYRGHEIKSVALRIAQGLGVPTEAQEPL